MGRAEVLDGDRSSERLAVGREGPHRLPVQAVLHGLAGVGLGRAAKPRLELEPIKLWRVVAGGDHDATDGALSFNGKGNGRRGRRVRRQHDLESVADKNAGGASG